MIFLIGVAVSFVLYVAVGALVGRRVKTQSDYFVAGRRAPTVLVTGSLVASFLSTVAFMGEVGFAYDGYPILMLVLTPLNAAGYVLGVMLFGRFLRRSEVLTVPEFFGKRFRSPGLQALAGGTVVIGIGAYLIAVTQGASLLLGDLVGVPHWAALLVVWIAYTSFTFFSGSPGVLLTDTIMFFIFVLGGVAGMSYLLWRAGGPTTAVSKLADLGDKPGIVSWHGIVTGPNAQMGSPAEALVWAVTLGIVWMTIVAVSPWQTSRYLMARNEHVSIRSGVLAMAVVLLLYVFLMLGGASVNLFHTGISPSETAFIWAARHVLPTGLGVLVVTGILAAALSSASTFLSLIGFSVGHDILPHLRQWKPAGSTVAMSRLVMLITSLAVLMVTYVAPPAVLTIGYFAATLFAASWGPVAILSIYSVRITRRGAVGGMAAGFVTAFVLQGMVEFGGLSLPVWANPVILSFAASLFGIVAGSLSEQPDPQALSFRHALLRPPAQELEHVRVRTTLRFTAGAVPFFVGISLLLSALYFLPFASLPTHT